MDSTAIITGGTGGLGSAVVRRLLDAGWRDAAPLGYFNRAYRDFALAAPNEDA